MVFERLKIIAKLRNSHLFAKFGVAKMKFKTNVIFALFFLIFIVDFNAAKKIEKFLAGDVNDRIVRFEKKNCQ